MLLAAGADPNIQNGEQDTPLYMAVLSNNIECVKVIAEKDVQFNCANVEGFTPLHYAAGEGNLPVTQYLVEACECDPEAPDNLGLTPGFCAVLQGRVEVAEYLLQVSPAGARARNMASDTVLHCALKAQANNRRLLEILIEHGTDVRAVGADRISCEEMLLARGYGDLVEKARARLPAEEAAGRTGSGTDHDPRHFPWLRQYVSSYIETHADGLPAKPTFDAPTLQDEWEFVQRK